MEDNNQTGQVSSGQPEMNNQMSDNASQAPQSSTPEQKSMGSLVGILIILVVIILGGWYFLNQRSQEVPFLDEENVRAEASINALETQGTSDELDSIEADLNATDLSDLDAELDSINAELNSL